jgi:hypothetical protein
LVLNLVSSTLPCIRQPGPRLYSGCFLLPPQNESMTTVHIKIALATLATTATELDLEADCGVCFNRFTSENELALPCGHAVCSTCVPGLSRTEQGLISCPYCSVQNKVSSASCPYCRTGTRPECSMPAMAEAPARATSKF